MGDRVARVRGRQVRRRRQAVLGAAAAVGLGGCAALLGPVLSASAGSGDAAAGARFVLRDTASGACVDGGVPQGQHARVQACDGSARQQWLLSDAGPGRFVVVNAASGLVLDDLYESKAVGANVVLWPKYEQAHANQEWTLPAAGASGALRNMHSGLVAGVVRSARGAAELVQVREGARRARSWQVVPVSAPSTPAPSPTGHSPSPSTSPSPSPSTTASAPAAPTGPGFYVSPDGSDAADGRSRATAFRTLQRGADAAGPGDTVYVLDGTYSTTSTNAVVTLSRSGTPGRPITLKAYPGAHPKLLLHAGTGVQVWGASYVRIEGLTIQGDRSKISYEQAYAGRTNGNDRVLNSNGVYIQYNGTSYPTHVEVIGNTISDTTASGISAERADYVTITGNTVHSTSWWTSWATSGISVFHSLDSDSSTGVKNVVSGNVVYDNETKIPWQAIGQISDGNGIIIDDNKHDQDTKVPYRGRTLVANNLAVDNGGSGVHVFSSQHVDVVNNTGYLNSRSPALSWANIDAVDSNDVNLLNNVSVARPGKVTLDGIGSGTGNRYDYNVFAGGTGAALPGPHDLSADPGFVRPGTDPATADFALAAGSPARGSGTHELSPATDLLGRPRPATGGIDRGAVQSS